MTLKSDLLCKGYLPENVPPSFTTRNIADYLQRESISGFLGKGKAVFRPARYNASKRGMTRRVFSLVHPVTAHDLAHFVETRWSDLEAFFAKSPYSLSAPVRAPNAHRALTITPHNRLEQRRIQHLAEYRFLACTDIARFYHTIYTHSVPWAYHGKPASKSERRVDSATVFCNRLDHILRAGQDGQTMGIAVGPDTARVVAELIGTAIDLAFQERTVNLDCAVLRHVDDIWIGAHTHADAETALSRYREAIREFELDINEAKTRIWSEEFRFADGWPTEIAAHIDRAMESRPHRVDERLRAALEHAFSLSVREGDDGILRYVIRYIDQHKLTHAHWSAIEPFLKRAAVHFGHTIDFISRILVWRQVRKRDLDREAWIRILMSILDKHGRLGNDSEVCWALYTCAHLGVPVPDEHARHILANCGALSVVALLDLLDMMLVDFSMLDYAFTRLSGEDASGPFWPVLLEWSARRRPRHDELTLNQPLITDMAAQGVYIYDSLRRPPVFSDVDDEHLEEVEFAIEDVTSSYDDDSDDPELDDDPVDF